MRATSLRQMRIASSVDSRCFITALMSKGCIFICKERKQYISNRVKGNWLQGRARIRIQSKLHSSKRNGLTAVWKMLGTETSQNTLFETRKPCVCTKSEVQISGIVSTAICLRTSTGLVVGWIYWSVQEPLKHTFFVSSSESAGCGILLGVEDNQGCIAQHE